MQKKRKLVLIDWFDHSSFSQNRWRMEDEFDNLPCSVSTVGWLMKENKDCITVASTVSHEDDERYEDSFKGDLTILKCAIKRIKRLT